MKKYLTKIREKNQDNQAQVCAPMPKHTLVSQLKTTSLPPESCIQNSSNIYSTLIFLIHASIKNKSKLPPTQSKQAKNNASPQSNLTNYSCKKTSTACTDWGKVRTGETYTCTLTASCASVRERMLLWKDFDAT